MGHCDSCNLPFDRCKDCDACDCWPYHINGGIREYVCGPDAPTEENNRLRQLLAQAEHAWEIAEDELEQIKGKNPRD